MDFGLRVFLFACAVYLCAGHPASEEQPPSSAAVNDRKHITVSWKSQPIDGNNAEGTDRKHSFSVSWKKAAADAAQPTQADTNRKHHISVSWRDAPVESSSNAGDSQTERKHHITIGWRGGNCFMYILGTKRSNNAGDTQTERINTSQLFCRGAVLESPNNTEAVNDSRIHWTFHFKGANVEPIKNEENNSRYHVVWLPKGATVQTENNLEDRSDRKHITFSWKDAQVESPNSRRAGGTHQFNIRWRGSDVEPEVHSDDGTPITVTRNEDAPENNATATST